MHAYACGGLLLALVYAYAHTSEYIRNIHVGIGAHIGTHIGTHCSGILLACLYVYARTGTRSVCTYRNIHTHRNTSSVYMQEYTHT